MTVPVVSETVPLSSAASGALRWVEVVDGAPAVLEVPTDHPRRRDLGSEVALEAFCLSPALIEHVRTIAETVGSSPTDVLVSVWAALVARTSDQRDVVLGDVSGAAGAVRLLRVSCPPDATLTDLLSQQRARTAELADATATPLEELLVLLGAEPATNKHPVFQIGVAVQESGRDTAARIGDDPYTPCDLVFGIDAVDPSKLCIQYSPSLYSAERIRRMGAHLTRLLDAALRSPDRPLDDIELVGGEELAALTGWNSTEGPLDPCRTMVDLVVDQIQRTPERIAVELNGQGITYRELGARADALAERLRAVGVGPDVLVAVSIDRSIEMIVALVGVLKAGGAYVPVDPAYPQQRRDYIVADASVAAVVRAGADGALLVEPVGEPVARRGDNVSDASDAPGARLAYVIYTSGSTGQPKGVAIAHTSAVNLLEWQRARDGFRQGARTLQFTSLSFDVSVQEIFSTLVSGGTLVMVADETRRNPLTLLDHMIVHRVQRLFLPFVALRPE